jgi:hypothetical protein
MRIGRPARNDEIELYINPRPVKRAVRRNNARREGFEMEADNPVPSRKVGSIVYLSVYDGIGEYISECDAIGEKRRMPELCERTRTGGTNE